jgi:hypothetical protein
MTQAHRTRVKVEGKKQKEQASTNIFLSAHLVGEELCFS